MQNGTDFLTNVTEFTNVLFQSAGQILENSTSFAQSLINAEMTLKGDDKPPTPQPTGAAAYATGENAMILGALALGGLAIYAILK